MKASTGLKKMLSILMSAVLILLLDATAFAEEPGSSTAVSYTHLDVYKRQVQGYDG